MIMRKLTISAFAVCAILVSGCWTLSVDPLYSEDTLVFQPELLGIWGDPDDSSSGTWTFLPVEGQKAYRLVIEEPEKPDGLFEAHLVQLGDHLFMDLYPEEPGSGNEFYVGHVIPAHSIWKMSIQGYVVTLDILDSQWLKQQIDSGKSQLQHLRRDDVIVLTASTAELQTFVQEHAEEAFTDDPFVMQRRR
jgi:hypothetical protein